MEQYFLYLQNLRTSHADNPASPLNLHSRIYVLFMNAPSSATNEMVGMKRTFLELIPQDPDEIHFFAWGLNAMARYYCFIEKNYSESLRYLELTEKWAENLWEFHFESFDQEIKCFTLIVELNRARLLCLSGNVLEGKKKLTQLEHSLINGTVLKEFMTNTIKESLLKKISREREKWGL